MIEFSWDESKRRENISRRRVDFVRVTKIFDGPFVESTIRAPLTEKSGMSRLAKPKVNTTSPSTRGEAQSATSSRRGKSMKQDVGGIKEYSRADLDAKEARGEVFETPPDAPTYSLDEAFWTAAKLVIPKAERKESVHLRVDNDVLDWFKKQGKGHLTRMNAVLRAYYQVNSRK